MKCDYYATDIVTDYCDYYMQLFKHSTVRIIRAILKVNLHEFSFA